MTSDDDPTVGEVKRRIAEINNQSIPELHRLVESGDAVDRMAAKSEINSRYGASNDRN